MSIYIIYLSPDASRIKTSKNQYKFYPLERMGARKFPKP